MSVVKFFVFLLCVLSFTDVKAQNFKLTPQEKQALIADDTELYEIVVPYEKKSFFTTGINYMSNNVYLGRKDSVIVPYLSPYIGYEHNSGLYGKVLLSFTNTPDAHLDLFTIETGYQHKFGSVNIGGSFDKYYFNKNSLSVKSSFTGSATLFGIYNNDYIEPQINFDANFGRRTDYVFGGSIDHLFSTTAGKLMILPTVAINLGTQYYYDEYSVRKKEKIGKKTRNVNVPVTLESSKFQPMDYEFSTQLIYKQRHWTMIAIPQYVIPVHPANFLYYGVNYPELISNSFILELDICYRY